MWNINKTSKNILWPWNIKIISKIIWRKKKSIQLMKVENSSLFSIPANEFLTKVYLKFVPTEAFIWELPLLLKSQIFKPYMTFSDFCEFAEVTRNLNVQPNGVFICWLCSQNGNAQSEKATRCGFHVTFWTFQYNFQL